jgi:uncharacterized membrane protein
MTRSTPLGVTLAAVLLGIEGLVVMAQGALSLLVALQFGGILGLALGGVLFVVGWVMLGAALGLRKRSPLAWRVALGVLGVTVVSSVLLVLSPSGQGPGPSVLVALALLGYLWVRRDLFGHAA